MKLLFLFFLAASSLSISYCLCIFDPRTQAQKLVSSITGTPNDLVKVRIVKLLVSNGTGNTYYATTEEVIAGDCKSIPKNWIIHYPRFHPFVLSVKSAEKAPLPMLVVLLFFFAFFFGTNFL